MAEEFTSNFQSLKPYFPCLDIEPNMELIHQFPELNPSVLQNLQLNGQSFMGFSNDTFFSNQTTGFQGNLGESFPGMFHLNDQNATSMPITQPNVAAAGDQYFHEESMKMKPMDVSESSCSGISSPPVSESGMMIKRKNFFKQSSAKKGKRVKCNENEEDDKPQEVVHVRARRGQATDSHSLAERVRRGKINERLKCLQDIVPGCYKTMGMAVMLDEIINYVQSLQNQVEFLSMKLTAASTFYDFNTDSEPIHTMQRAKVQEIAEIERLMKEANEGLACLQPTWPL